MSKLSAEDALSVEELKSRFLSNIDTGNMTFALTALIQTLGIVIANCTPTRIDETSARAMLWMKDIAHAEVKRRREFEALNRRTV